MWAFLNDSDEINVEPQNMKTDMKKSFMIYAFDRDAFV